MTYQNFIKAGANLSDDDKNKLKEINSKLATLTNKFGQTLLEAGNDAALIITDVSKLDGLTQGEINSLKDKEKTNGSSRFKIPPSSLRLNR